MTNTEILSTIQQARANNNSINLREIASLINTSEDYTAITQDLVNNKNTTKAAFEKLVNSSPAEKALVKLLGEIPNNPSGFFEAYIQKIEPITVKINGCISRDIVRFNGVPIDKNSSDAEIRDIWALNSDLPYIAEDLKRELRIFSTQHNLNFRPGDLSDVVDQYISNRQKYERTLVFDAIRYRSSIASSQKVADDWNAFETAGIRSGVYSPGFASAVIKKFMYQVKRKAYNLEIKDHIMPVIVGLGGGGKSALVDAIVAPLGDGYKKVDFRMITDSKTMDIWELPVLVFDEMAGAPKANIEKVKSLITADRESMRVMRENKSANIKQSATFIGTANNSLSSIVRDSTTMRRFAELIFKHKAEVDWVALNQIDWANLWRSVDPRGTDPLAPFAQELDEQQEDNRNVTAYESFIEDTEQKLRKKGMSSRELYADFREWCEKYDPGFHIPSANRFGKALTELSALGTVAWLKSRKKDGKSFFEYREV